MGFKLLVRIGCVLIVLSLGWLFFESFSFSSTDESALAFVPVQVRTTTPLVLSAEAHMLVYVGPYGRETVLMASHEHTPFPIASVTKLMTAYVASQVYAPGDAIEISHEALVGKGRSGIYNVGMRFSLDGALHALLIPSHDEIADALALSSIGGVEAFVVRMNTSAQTLGLAETSYVNPSGLDPYDLHAPTNLSSAYDVYHLLRSIKETEPELFSITSTRTYELTDAQNQKIASFANTDALLDEPIGHFRITGGKTGQTPRANQALVVSANTRCGGTLYAVVLRSADRFADIKNLLAAGDEAFSWNCAPPTP